MGTSFHGNSSNTMRMNSKSADRLFPSQTKSNPTGSFTTQNFWKDSSDITSQDFKELYSRNGIYKAIVNRIANDCHRKWWEPDNEDEQLRKYLKIQNNARKGLNIRRIFKRADVYRLRDGMSCIYMGSIDEEPEASNPLKLGKNGRITYLKVIESEDVIDFQYAENGVGIEKYQIRSYHGDGLTTEHWVHASRILHLKNGETDDPRGVPFGFGVYNYLEVYDKMIWSCGTALKRGASGFPIMYLKEGTAADLKLAREMIETIGARTGWAAFEDDARIEIQGMEGKSLKPAEYLEGVLKAIAMSLNIPFAILEGANAGAVTGSETNLEDWYGQMGARQDLEIQPHVEELNEVLQESGQLPPVIFEIIWNELWTISRKEQAEIDKLQAETDEIRVFMGEKSINEIRRLRETRNIEPDPEFDIENGDKYKSTTPSSNPFTASPLNQKGEQENKEELDSVPIRVLKEKTTLFSSSPDRTGSFSSDVFPLAPTSQGSKFETAPFIKLERELITSLSKQYDFRKISKLINNFAENRVTDSSLRVRFNDDTLKEIMVKIEFNIDSNLGEVRDVVDQHFNKAFDMGVRSAEEELSKKAIYSLAAVTTKGNIKEIAFGLVKGLNDDLKKNLRVLLYDQLFNSETGTSLAKVKRSLRSVLPDMEIYTNRKIETIAISETNDMLNAANFHTYESMGVKQVQWMSEIDNRTSQICIENHLEIRNLGEKFPSGHIRPKAHPRCRSSLMAVIS